jgi:hypothetical protein
MDLRGESRLRTLRKEEKNGNWRYGVSDVEVDDQSYTVTAHQDNTVPAIDSESNGPQK